MNVLDDGRCSYHASRAANGGMPSDRCSKRTDARFVLTFTGNRGSLEALLPFGACSEHAEGPGRMVQSEDASELCKLPGVMHAIEAYRERFKEDPTGAQLAVIGVETDEYRQLVRLGKASGQNGAGAPILVEHARAKDVKEDMGEDAYKKAFGSS